MTSSNLETCKPDRDSQHQELSEIVTRLNALVGNGTLSESRAPKPTPSISSVDQVDDTMRVNIVRQTIRERRAREELFPLGLFADPAWDILLDLYSAGLAFQRVTTTSLCEAACVPPTTALRWIHAMEVKGILKRFPDRLDGRRVFVELSPDASEKMRQYADKLLCRKN